MKQPGLASSRDERALPVVARPVSRDRCNCRSREPDELADPRRRQVT